MAIGQSVEHIVSDFKSSWYFRIWSLGFLVCCIVVLIGWTHFTAIAALKISQYNLRFWNAFTPSLEFPDLQFSMSLDGLAAGERFNLNETTCYFGIFRNTTGPVVPVSACPPSMNYPQGTCVTVMSSKFSVTPPQFNRSGEGFNHTGGGSPGFFGFHSNVVRCNVAVVSSNSTASRDIIFNTMAPDWNGRTAATGYYLQPNNAIWVYLTATFYHMGLATDPLISWDRNVMYHGASLDPVAIGSSFVYTVTVSIDSLLVDHFAFQNEMDGWVVFGLYGGMVVSMIVALKIFMCFIGCCVQNNSKFLNSCSGSEASTAPASFAPSPNSDSLLAGGAPKSYGSQ